MWKCAKVDGGREEKKKRIKKEMKGVASKFSAWFDGDDEIMETGNGNGKETETNTKMDEDEDEDVERLGRKLMVLWLDRRDHPELVG